jgi:U4/U6 small nuclear ribonucleoprotein PRP3
MSVAAGGGSGMSIEPVKANPYTSAVRVGAGSGPTAGGFEGAPKERVGGKMQFNTKGKYIAQGNQMRNQVRFPSFVACFDIDIFGHRRKLRH